MIDGLVDAEETVVGVVELSQNLRQLPCKEAGNGSVSHRSLAPPHALAGMTCLTEPAGTEKLWVLNWDCQNDIYFLNETGPNRPVLLQ